MAIGNISLSKVINKDFVTTIQKMSKLSSGSSSKTSSASSGDATSFSSSLRNGARIYANSISAMNSLISYLNISHDTLTSLIDITDGMLELANEAKKTTLGNQSRNRLNIKYNKLKKQFKELVEAADKSERNFLTKEGIQNLLSVVGLKTEESESIGSIFEQFIFDGDDHYIASMDIKPKKDATIPKQAYGKQVSSETSKYSVLSFDTGKGQESKEIQDVGISTNFNVIQENIDGNDVISFINRNTGQNTILGNDGFQYSLKDVNKETGYSIISRYEDSKENSNLYLMDSFGKVIQKLNDVEGNFSEAKISNDLKTILYSKKGEESTSLVKLTIENIGSEEGIQRTTLDTKDNIEGDVFSDLKLNGAGTFVAYKDNVDEKIYFKDMENVNNDSYFSSLDNVLNFDFISERTLAIYDGHDIKAYEYQSGLLNTIYSDVNAGKFETIEGKNGGNSIIAFTNEKESEESEFVVINKEGKEILNYKYDRQNGEDIKDFSLGFNTSNVVEVGVVSNASSFGQTDENNFYRIMGETASRYAKGSKVAASAFSSSVNLNTPVDAYRAENSLKALKDQLEENLKVMDSLLEAVDQNIELARATGYALLDLSEEVSSFDDAASIARSLKIKIRKNAPQALAQAENLEPIAVATMLLNDELKK